MKEKVENYERNKLQLRPGRISIKEKANLLHQLGIVAQELYDYNITRNEQGYNLHKLQGSLKFAIDPHTMSNHYYLEGKDEKWTNIAYYFEYGTGLYNSKRAGRYRAGYIHPVTEDYMTFLAKDGKWVSTDRVKGVRPILAMNKALRWINHNRKKIFRILRWEYQND